MARIKEKPEASASGFSFCLDNVCFLECCVCSVFCDCSKTFCRNLNDYVLIKLSYIDSLLVEVWCTLCNSRRIKLRRTSAVTVFSTSLGLFSRDFTLFCHIVVF